MSAETNTMPPSPGDGDSRRDFLILASGTMAAVGTAIAVWPFIDSMNPSADVLALSSVDVDLSPIELGQRITVVWRGKPIFIDHRPSKRIEEATADDKAKLRDVQTDAERVENPEWLIVIGICTHLGCIPLGQKASDPRGEWDGWFCPCHGSEYDTAGRIRKGPAPRNLDLPGYRSLGYRFLGDGKVRIG